MEPLDYKKAVFKMVETRPNIFVSGYKNGYLIIDISKKSVEKIRLKPSSISYYEKKTVTFCEKDDLIVVSRSRTLCFVKYGSENLDKVVPTGYSWTSLGYSRKFDRLLTGNGDGDIFEWRVEDAYESEVETFKYTCGNGFKIVDIQCSGDLCVAATPHWVFVVNLETLGVVQRIKMKNGEYCHSVSVWGNVFWVAAGYKIIRFELKRKKKAAIMRKKKKSKKWKKKKKITPIRKKASTTPLSTIMSSNDKGAGAVVKFRRGKVKSFDKTQNVCLFISPDYVISCDESVHVVFLGSEGSRKKKKTTTFSTWSGFINNVAVSENGSLVAASDSGVRVLCNSLTRELGTLYENQRRGLLPPPSTPQRKQAQGEEKVEEVVGAGAGGEEEKKKMDVDFGKNFLEMPDEVVLKVLCFLPVCEIFRFAEVSKRTMGVLKLNSHSEQHVLWNVLLDEKYKKPGGSSQAHAKGMFFGIYLKMKHLFKLKLKITNGEHSQKKKKNEGGVGGEGEGEGEEGDVWVWYNARNFSLFANDRPMNLAGVFRGSGHMNWSQYTRGGGTTLEDFGKLFVEGKREGRLTKRQIRDVFGRSDTFFSKMMKKEEMVKKCLLEENGFVFVMWHSSVSHAMYGCYVDSIVLRISLHEKSVDVLFHKLSVAEDPD